MSTAELLTRIERYCKRNKIAPSTFGRNAVGASNLLDRLRAGKTVTVETAAKIDSYMKSKVNGQ